MPTHADIPISNAITKADNIAKKTIEAGALNIDCTQSVVRLMICAGYLIYAVLVIHSIGSEAQYFGRTSLKILNSDVSLDPNVVSASFVLPMMICMFNLLNGRLKLISSTFLLVFMIAIMALGSRGSALALGVSTLVLLYDYLIANITFYIKF